MEYPIPMVFVQVMAVHEIRISIKDLEDPKMCTQSSNKLGLQIYLPSNFSAQMIEGELGKPRTKSLKEDPNQLSEMSVDENYWSFYKVPYPLREVNVKAYEPHVISIGPYHHGKKHLKTMEVIKRNCFSRMIKKSKVEPKKFVTVMKKLEKRVRKCYEEPLDRFDSDTFVEMMVLDGCFIVLLFQKNNSLLKSLGKLRNGILDEIYCDLLLLENQLPFFVLSELYAIIMSTAEIDEFPRLAFSLLSPVIPEPDICYPKKFPKPKNINHLLGLVHSSWISSAGKRHDAKAEEETETDAKKETETEAKAKAEEETETEAKAEEEPEIEAEAEEEEEDAETETEAEDEPEIETETEEEEEAEAEDKHSWKFIRCATELEDVGIKFVKKGEELQDGHRKDKIRKVDEGKNGKPSLFDIDFTDDGKLKIPTLSVDDNTERILRNFMAYEQLFPSSEQTNVSDYVTLMDNLINSGKDVQLLCKRGIIDNWLGDDEVVAQMFNRLGDRTYSGYFDDFDYADIFDMVDNHCKRRRNKWMAEFYKKHFHSPWSIISVVAGVVLLLLTLVQTIFSGVSYVHPK